MYIARSDGAKIDDTFTVGILDSTMKGNMKTNNVVIKVSIWQNLYILP